MMVKNFFDQLNRREKYMVTVAAGFLLIFLVYSLMVQPLVERMAYYQDRIPAQRELVVWMESASRQIENIRMNSQNGIGDNGGESLLTVVSKRAKEQGFGKNLKRVEPVGEAEVRLWLDGVIFEDMAPWLLMLQEQNGLRVSEISLDRDKAPGIVNARITFKGVRP